MLDLLGNLHQRVSNYPYLVFLSRRGIEFSFEVVGVVGDDSGCGDVIVTSQRPSGVLRFPFSTGVLSELKMVTSFFVKSMEQSELHSCTIERRMAIFRFVYVWACVASDGNFGRVKWPESLGWIMELLWRRTRWGVVVGCGFFKITLYLPQIQSGLLLCRLSG